MSLDAPHQVRQEHLSLGGPSNYPYVGTKTRSSRDELRPVAFPTLETSLSGLKVTESFWKEKN